MRTPLIVSLATCATFALTAAAAHAEGKRELHSHEHGHVKLQIAIEKNQMNIGFEAPGESIVGFEHAAKTDEQKAAVTAARKQLSDAAAVFAIPQDAGCASTTTEVELHQEGDHNAFEAKYAFSCTNMKALTGMETKLFMLYPAIKEIDVEFATEKGQGRLELEADAPTIKLSSGS